MLFLQRFLALFEAIMEKQPRDRLLAETIFYLLKETAPENEIAPYIISNHAQCTVKNRTLRSDLQYG